MPHDGRARAGVSPPPASGADAATGVVPAPPSEAAGDQVLAFAGVAVVAVYVPGEEELRQAETVRRQVSPYRLSERVPLAEGSPAAHAFRTGRPLWLSPADLATYGEPHAEAPLGALPLTADGVRLGCLVVVGVSGTGFEAEQRHFLERYADAVARVLPAGARGSVPSPVLRPALRNLHAGSFVLVPDTGVVEADETLLGLLGIAPADFDGKADTLLAHAVPEDMHALVSVLEPAAQPSARRELEFRVRGPAGEMRWLSLSCRVVAGGDAGPERVLGVVTATRVLRRGSDDVSRIQWLTAALDEATTVPDVGRVVVTALREPLGADRVALAELQGDRLTVTVLDPPQPDHWPETWRAQWRSEWPDAAVSSLPTLQLALRDGRLDLWPAGSAFEAGLAGIGEGGLAVLPLPARGRIAGVCLVGWDRPHAFLP
ncbi:MAG: PAS domain-containing protein, partial [Nonomuraea sp.]|nr:PAS domain-containing protein [Nonomuraea sp.]